MRKTAPLSNAVLLVNKLPVTVALLPLLACITPPLLAEFCINVQLWKFVNELFLASTTPPLLTALLYENVLLSLRKLPPN